jgi:hypothetical protein
MHPLPVAPVAVGDFPFESVQAVSATGANASRIQ